MEGGEGSYIGGSAEGGSEAWLEGTSRGISQLALLVSSGSPAWFFSNSLY